MVIKTKELKDKLKTIRDLNNDCSAYTYTSRVQLEFSSEKEGSTVTMSRLVYDLIIEDLQISERKSEELHEIVSKLLK